MIARLESKLHLLLGRSELRPSLRLTIAAVILGGGLYGSVLGSFAGFTGEGAKQSIFAAVKVPLMIAATTFLSLPTFFVFHTLLGLRDDFGTAMRAVLRSQGATAIVLASFAPYIALWYASTTSYYEAIFVNGLCFLAAGVSSQVVLRRGYAELIARNRLHRWMIPLWLSVYCFTAVQMAWVLRPFVGYPGLKTTFLRDGDWGNAYVAVAQTVSRTILP